jgi:hypothetical protein
MRQQAQIMEEQVAQVVEINTGLTTAVEKFKLSNATERNSIDQQSVTPTRVPVPRQPAGSLAQVHLSR